MEVETPQVVIVSAEPVVPEVPVVIEEPVAAPTKSLAPSKKLNLGIGITVAVVVVIAIAVLASSGSSDDPDKRKVCKEVEAEEEKGEKAGLINTPLSIQDMKLCHGLKCTFETLKCENSCPFSYKLDDDDCPVSCECAGKGVMEGDIAYNEADVPLLLEEYGLTDGTDDFAIKDHDRSVAYWKPPKGNKTAPVSIYYLLDEDLTKKQKAAWNKAIGQLKKKTCVQMKPWDEEALDYLFVTKSTKPDCSSYIGRKGGMQKIVMGNCYSSNHAEHLLMHALGFPHEHTRYDREAFIKVILKNVLKEQKPNFKMVVEKRTKPYPTEFDTDSVTMFNGFAFSINEETKPTILDVETGQPLVVKANGMFSEKDVSDINFLYCKGRLAGIVKPTPANPLLFDDMDAAGNETELAERSAESGEDMVTTTTTTIEPVTVINFAWSRWETWGHCDHTCGEATRSRYRLCINTEEQESNICSGESSDVESCKDVPCPVESELKVRWSGWTEFGECSKTCGTGVMLRTRECSDGKVVDSECEGSKAEELACNTDECDMAHFNTFDEWTDWKECSLTCGTGLTSRSRECKDIQRKIALMCDGGFFDDGMQHETKICNTEICPDGWKSEEWYSDSDQSEAVEEPSFFIKSDKPLSATTCEPGDNVQWVTGDFNDDERNDILCMDWEGNARIVLSGETDGLNEVSWEGTLDKCLQKLLFTGDFNGDGTTDIMCVAVEGDSSDIMIFPVRYGKPKTVVRAGAQCVGENWEVYVIDSNGDNRDDILCRDTMEDKNSKIHVNVMDV